MAYTINPAHPATIRRIGVIRKATLRRALTPMEVSSTIHLCHQSVLRYLHHLHKDGKLLIEEWKRPYVGHVVPAYRWGKGVDAPKPPPQDHAEAQRAYIERVRQDPVRNSLRLNRARVLERKRSGAPIHPASPFAALGL